VAEPLPKRIYRKDYRQPDYWIDAALLHFDLGEEETRVRSKLRIRRHGEVADGAVPLVLHGEELELREIRLDGRDLGPQEYALREESLAVHRVPERFELETLVAIRPQDNTELSGLYKSAGNFCTQCEAEGFRRITWYLDRPDVMAAFTTVIEAERARYPVLLSNGNRVAEGELPGGRHRVRYEDPFRKPCYLFALVAGDLRCHAGTFVTRSGRTVRLEIWVEPRNLDRCEHALRSLQKAMRWEEEVFGREYDLDVYMIVAVGDFNMGAMENKGLNIFNSKYVLARPDTATDDDYEAIEGVIAHEYFHNWTGNRVTCRDWFQLTLKEGLTVFRDQLFTADSTSPALKRISDVRTLRQSQFPEDAGPMAHPIRPESYIEMNNFYTPTVYEKGAEVVRMLHTLLGPGGFRRGMDLYFERHDGQAVTCDDFRAAMADANGVDLAQFERWYLQPGTPILEAEGRHDPARASYELTLRQRRPETPVEFDFEPLHVPVAVGLLAPDGRELPLRLEGEPDPGRAGTTRVLELREAEQRFRFVGVEEPPVPSLLRGFSAPVRLVMPRPRAELAFLMGRDSDPVNRWEAGQTLARELLLELCGARAAGLPLVLDPLFVEAFRRVLLDPGLDGSLKALALSLPTERELAQAMAVVDVEGLHAAREFAIAELARQLRADFESIHAANLPEGPTRIDRDSIARRRLKNATLRYLTCAGDPESLARLTRQFESADNMTDRQAALVLLAEHPGPARESALAAFYARFERDPLVVDKWFSVQAQSSAPDTVERVRALCGHPAFTLRNPNRVRSLVGAFATSNAFHFHAADGAGYAFLADRVLELDPLNPQVAARLAASLSSWRRYDPGRQALMKQQLERIAGAERLSKDVYEIVERTLKG
jgi:aminopeptidase N